jgi:GNAT superfamily N-acetyltransferase
LSGSDLRIEALERSHCRDGFTSGEPDLDRYLKQQAGQDLRRRINAVLVMTALAEPDTVLGYYTLCATALAPGEIPEAARARLPRYPHVSATLLGRLAIAANRQGEGLGAILLADAIRRAWASAAHVGSCMLVVDALNARAAAFYAAFGFVAMPESPRLILPFRTLERD